MKKILIFLVLNSALLLLGCSINKNISDTSKIDTNPISETEKICTEYAKKEKDFAIKMDENVIKQGIKIPRTDYKKVYNDAYSDCIKLRVMFK